MGDVDRGASGGGSGADPSVAAEYRVLQLQATRDTTIIAGAVALVALPGWAFFDWVLIPDGAVGFMAARLAGEAAVAVLWSLLRWRRTPDRWIEPLSLMMVTALVVSIAWMVPRAGDASEAYVLGLTLPFYATAYLVVWRWRMTVVLSGLTALALAVLSLGTTGVGLAQLTTLAFYLVTAIALTLTAQVYRARRSWQQHVTQKELEAERLRNIALVEELEQLSREDPLTAVGNRRAWDERLTGELLRARRSGRPLSLLVCDLDHFKTVNDRLGHTIGDAVLRTATKVLREGIRTTDFLARLGGDEFAVLCPDTSLGGAAEVAATLRNAIRDEAFPEGVTMTCSIGAAELERDDATTDDLYHRADGALYEAKVTRDTTRCAEPGATLRGRSTRPERATAPDPVAPRRV